MQSIFATKGDVLLLGSSGTGSLEAAVTNMFGPGDTVLACPTGVFGERIAAIAKIWGMGRRSRPTSTICAAACRPRKEDHRYSVDTQRNVYGCANRPGRNVARYWGSSRVRRRRFGKRLGRERIQDGRVETRYSLRCVTKSARVSARTCDDRSEPTRVGQDQSKQGATLLLRSTEAQRVFR